MKNLKMLGLAVALAAVGLMAYAGIASASTLTSPENTIYTGEITATSTNMEMDGAFVTVNCSHSKLEALVQKHGIFHDAGGSITELTFTGCNYPTTVHVTGVIDIDGGEDIDFFYTSISFVTSIGTCRFTAKTYNEGGTPMGSLKEGKNAYIALASNKFPRTGGTFLCGSSGTLTGTYDLTTPNELWVD